MNQLVKDPAVVTRKDFNPASMSPEAIERLKLEDGIYLLLSIAKCNNISGKKQQAIQSLQNANSKFG